MASAGRRGGMIGEEVDQCPDLEGRLGFAAIDGEQGARFADSAKVGKNLAQLSFPNLARGQPFR
jgi:hypothetical protein